MRASWIIGIDEVGRGALAGPVTVGVVAIRVGDRRVLKAPSSPLSKTNLPLRDSKQLTPLQREAWVRHLRQQKKAGADIWCVTESMSPKKVDHLNVAQAANWAATRALRNLLKMSGIHPRDARVVLDGGLYLKEPFVPSFKSVETIVKGDEKFPAIMLASIYAKVTRDKKLVALHARHPHYGFSAHKGYGTRAHIAAIKARGIIAVHRLTFVGKWVNLNVVWQEQVITQNQK